MGNGTAHTSARTSPKRSLAVVLLALAAFAASVGAASAAVKSKPDATYQTNGRVRAIAYANGAVYIGGAFTSVRPPGAPPGSGEVGRNHLAAFDEATGALLPWNPNADGDVWSLAVSGNTVYVGGKFLNVGGRPRARLAAVLVTTGVPTSWNPGANGPVYSLSIGPNDDVFAGGAFTLVKGNGRKRLAEIRPDGTLTSWHPAVTQVSGTTCPPRCSPFVATLDFSSDGSVVYFGGHFGLVDGVGRNNVAAVDRTTGARLPWNPDVFGTGAGTNPNQANKVWGVEVGGDRAYVCGDYWSLDGFQRHPNLAAVDLVQGHLVDQFAATTDGNTPACTLRDGLLYIGGHYRRVGPNSAWVFIPGQKATLTGEGSMKRDHIATLDPITGAIDSWSPSINSTLGVHTITSGPRHLGVGGDFTKAGGALQQGYAQFADAG
jgi:hypothetical protein